MAYSNFKAGFSFKKLLAIPYTIWVIFWFVLIFLFIFPLEWYYLQKPETKYKAHDLNRLWAKILMIIIGMRTKVQYDFMPEKFGTYIFVPNHFSYWDVAMSGLIIDNYFAFVGKMSVKNIPLLGYMFAKLHVQVDRAEKNSRAISMTRSIKALQSGRSMMIYAEGGILTDNPPHMVKPFKDGAFTMAIQLQLPIVPISMYNNYKIIWHDDSLLWPHTVHARVHAPVDTKGMNISQMEELKEHIWQIIQQDLLDNDAYKNLIIFFACFFC